MGYGADLKNGISLALSLLVLEKQHSSVSEWFKQLPFEEAYTMVRRGLGLGHMTGWHVLIVIKHSVKCFVERQCMNITTSKIMTPTLVLKYGTISERLAATVA